MRQLEFRTGRFEVLHFRIERLVRILIALAERELITHIAGEQLVAAGSGEDDLVTPLDLAEQIVERQDHRADRQFIEILDDVAAALREIELLLRVDDEQTHRRRLDDLLRKKGLIALGIGVIAVIRDFRLRQSCNEARIDTTAAKCRE